MSLKTRNHCLLISTALLFATPSACTQSMPGMEVELRPTPRPEIRHAREAAIRDYPRLATRLDLPVLSTKEQEEIKRLANAPDRAYVGIGRAAHLSTPNWALVKHEDGVDIWQAQIRSPAAVSLKVRFTDFALAPGTTVTVYGIHDSKYAPVGEYNGNGLGNNGQFWSLTIPGDTAVVEYRVPAGSGLQPGKFPFKVERISHTFRDSDGQLSGVD